MKAGMKVLYGLNGVRDVYVRESRLSAAAGYAEEGAFRSAWSRITGSGLFVAALCAVVSLGVVTAIVMAGRGGPGVTPPVGGTHKETVAVLGETKSESETDNVAETETVTETETETETKTEIETEIETETEEDTWEIETWAPDDTLVEGEFEVYVGYNTQCTYVMECPMAAKLPVMIPEEDKWTQIELFYGLLWGVEIDPSWSSDEFADIYPYARIYIGNSDEQYFLKEMSSRELDEEKYDIVTEDMGNGKWWYHYGQSEYFKLPTRLFSKEEGSLTVRISVCADDGRSGLGGSLYIVYHKEDGNIVIDCVKSLLIA